VHYLVSGVSGHTVTADRAYAPYGELYNTFGSTNTNNNMFAGLAGDFDTNVLFDTPNRELAQYQGRWLSPDPVGAGWNQYAYATNPNSSIDPSGLTPFPYFPNNAPAADEFDQMALYSNAVEYPGQALEGFSPLVFGPAPASGTVGTDGGSSYEPPGWNGGQQVQNYTPGTGPDGPAQQPLMPILELVGPMGPVFPVAGCGGAGIPCRALPYTPPGGTPWNKGSASGNSYSYSVVDVNGDPIQGAPVTEWYQNALSSGSAWTNGEGGGNTWINFSGTFTDFMGFGPGPDNMFLLNQMFTVQTGGTNYLLTTETQQFAIQGSNGSTFTTVTIITP